LPENTVQTSVTIHAEKETNGAFKLVQQDKQLVDISGNECLRLERVIFKTDNLPSVTGELLITPT